MLVLTPYREGVFPGYWRDEISDLPVAVEAYYAYLVDKKPKPTRYQLERIIAYLQYFINAPIWEANPHPEAYDELTRLRQACETLASVEGIDCWLLEALDFGLSPL